MTTPRTQVARFYRELWDAHDHTVVAEILHEDIRFRGSLGDEKRGHDGFLDYVDAVHRALDSYRCRIEDLVVEPPKAFARMTFSGVHVAAFMGYSPTNKLVSWSGAALFTFRDERISEIWVLGDLHGLETQLQKNQEA